MKTLFTFLLFALGCNFASAQCITYTYDNLGNRIARAGNCGGGTSCAFDVSTSNSSITVTPGGTVSLTSNCSGADCGSVNYQWRDQNSVTVGTTANVNITAPATSGTYTYTLTASKNDCSNKTLQVNVTVSGSGGGCGTGTGLTATYYSGTSLQGSPIATYTQGPIDFSGTQGQTISGTTVAGNNISARWEGQVEAPVNGSYTFNMRTDDGVRVWFNNIQVVDDFGDYAPKDHNFTVSLTANQKYNIKIEWKQGGGGYEAKLFWSYSGQGNQIVPACRLYPGGSSGGGCNGAGLTANYFNNHELQGSPIATLTQGPIDFIGNEGQTITGTSVSGVNVSARWEGQVEAPVSGSYTFNMRTDDGTRVWFNSTQVVNHWDYFGATDHNFTVSLAANQKYNIKIEWKQGGGGYEAKLFWSYPGQATQIVPVCRLYPSTGGCTPPSAPSLSASPSTITSGSSTLTATNCSGTVNWSTGATGSSTVVSPSTTTTYTATCTVGGCTSSSGSVTVTVGSSGGGGCVVNKVRLIFRNPGDCCMDRLVGAQIQGSNDGGATWTSIYTFNQNGNGTWQDYTFTNTVAYQRVRFSASSNGYGELNELEFYNGTTKLSGTAFGTDNGTNALDGSTSTGWHGTTSGPHNVAGLILTGCSGGCTPPSAPSLSASPSTITSGSSTLTATNCSGTVNWSTGATGSSTVVSPSTTTTYTATCTVGGCTSSSGSVTVTVGSSGGGGCVVNKVRLIFRNPGDCCMDRLVGAQIQGSNDGGATWTSIYTFNQNGNGTWQDFTFTNTVAYQRVRFSASSNGYGELNELEFYNGTTKLSGTAFGTDNGTNALDGSTSTGWHGTTSGPHNVAGLILTGCSGGCTPPSAPSLSASPSTITSGSSTLTATNCSGTVNWSTGATGSSAVVSPSTTTTYTATCTVGGCTSSSGSVTVTVGSSGGGGCVVNKVRLIFRSPGDCCMDRLVGAQIQGSNDGGATWTSIYTFNQNGNGTWQDFTFTNTVAYQRVRFSASSNGYGELNELEFYNGTTKLSGTAFGTDNGTNALDGSTSTGWHGTTSGPHNVAGLILTGCGGGGSGIPDNQTYDLALMDARNPLQLFPNPTNGLMTIRYYLEKGKTGSLQFVNLGGGLILQNWIEGQGHWEEKQIDLTGQPNGYYLLRFEVEKSIITRKFIIVK